MQSENPIGRRMKNLTDTKIFLLKIIVDNHYHLQYISNMKKTGSIFSKLKEKELETMCREHGLALTIQRRTILEALAARNDHPTADQIYEAVKDLLKGISKTTVYRVLETFVSFGIVRKISNPEAKARFDADTSRHHHATCLHCGVVMDVHDQNLNTLKFPVHVENGFEFVDYSINFTGLCTNCRAAHGNEGSR